MEYQDVIDHIPRFYNTERLIVRIMRVGMFFPKALALGVIGLVAIYTVGLFIYIYAQGGVEAAIHLGGW